MMLMTSSLSSTRHSKRRHITEEPIKPIQDLYHFGKCREFVPSRPSDAPVKSVARSEAPHEQSEEEVHISPVPLPPIYLGLDPTCSKDEEENSLRSAGVTSMTPIGFLDPTWSIDLKSPSFHYQSLTDLMTSPISQLPFPSEMFILQIESSSHPQSYIYRQSLSSLPPKVRHPSNLRLVIPYGLQQRAQTSHHPSGHLPTSNHPLPFRACIRTGTIPRSLLLLNYSCRTQWDFLVGSSHMSTSKFPTSISPLLPSCSTISPTLCLMSFPIGLHLGTNSQPPLGLGWVHRLRAPCCWKWSRVGILWVSIREY